MSPNFLPNAFVVSIKYPYQAYKVNDVVLVNHPTYGKIIKRIQQILDDGSYLLSGDNPQSSLSSQKMGKINFKNILGKVVYTVQPKS